MGLCFGAIVLAYNQEEYISYCVRALAPHVDHLVVVHAERPWSAYNPRARQMFTEPDGTRPLLTALQGAFANLTIIDGEWDREEGMRNAGLQALRRAGVDVCLSVDADEFHPKNGLAQLKAEIERRNAPGTLYYVPYATCFKRFDYVVETRYVTADGRPDQLRAAVAVHLDAQTTFSRMRHTSGTSVNLDSFSFWNMGYVLSDRRMWEKVNSWGHAGQVLPNWFEEKWRRWTPQTRDLFYRHPPWVWPRTIEIDPITLPEVLHTHPYFRRHEAARNPSHVGTTNSSSC